MAMQIATDDTETAAPRRLPIGKLLGGVAVLAGLVLLGRLAGDAIPAFQDWVKGLGFWAPAVFIAGYALAVVAFAPASLLTLAAGATFGVVSGTVYVFVAAVLGSSLAFLVARYAARPLVERRIAGDARFAAIDRAVGEQGRRIVLLLRLSPVFPFNLLNYALGVTGVRLVDYVVASVGMLPGTLLYVYSGSLAGEAVALAGGAGGGRGAGEYALLGVGLLATVVVTVLVTRIARQALREATGDDALSDPDHA
ncbi:MAG: TVP38/TMEM64 family protein [Myxococcota bacterium]|nr:TVP38/TMEM64 family protein [Myxococcota bacterium]